MEKINLASVDLATRIDIKNQTVQLHLVGKKHEGIVEMLGISYDAVSRIIRAYRKNGKLNEEKTRGRKKGEKRTLSAKQEIEIQRIIIDKCPDRMKLNAALWTRGAVKQIIYDLYGIDMPLRSVSNYLKRWGMACHTHPKKYCFLDMQKWKFLTQEYPFIVKMATTDKAVIYWSGETGVNNQQHYVSTRYRNNMLFAINGRGTFRFMYYWGNITPQLFADFMKRLVRDSQGKKVFLIVDSIEVCYGEYVCDWLEKNKDFIKLFFSTDPSF